jgi:hypothetical protein
MSDSLQLKTTYKPKAKLEAFYTGAAARVTRDGKHVVCACGDEVKVVDLATGAVVKTLAGVSGRCAIARQELPPQTAFPTPQMHRTPSSPLSRHPQTPLHPPPKQLLSATSRTPSPSRPWPSPRTARPSLPPRAPSTPRSGTSKPAAAHARGAPTRRRSRMQ